MTHAPPGSDRVATCPGRIVANPVMDELRSIACQMCVATTASSFIRIVHAVADQPVAFGRMHDFSCGLVTTDDGPLHHGSDAARELIILEGERETLVHLASFGHRRIISSGDKRRAAVRARGSRI
jgi:hypothetical protein